MYRIECYRLDFRFRFDELKYDCEETVEGEFSDVIEFDNENLDIREVRMDGVAIPFRTEGKRLIMGPARGNEITISFSGNVSQTSLMGIHESKYEGGHLITTQMEPTAARSVFPCIDEPAVKARFKVGIDVDKEVGVIFNTRPATREVGKGRAHFVFDETPPMSTYLIYIGIGKFDVITKKKKGRTLLLAAAPGKAPQGKFSLNLLGKLFTKYEAYYKIKYPLPKMHLIAVPQFEAGAMENWGAITFREIVLLVNESVSFRGKKEIGNVVSHEFAHQWFGDLVTMKWWDDLWLNESFATFVGNKLLAKVQKDWNVWEDFLRIQTLSSMQKDGLLTTHPIRVEVKDPDEISEIFDDISYGKGASILRMTEQFIGESKFREGVYQYLKSHEYSNASGEDLWSSLSASSKLDVNGFMKSWLEKAGFPLVRIKREDGELIIRQQKFSYLENSDEYLWRIPVFLSRQNKRRKLLLRRRQTRVKNADNLKINSNGEGYYRTLFEGDLINQAISSNSSPEFLMKLIDDYYAFLRSGDVEMETFLSILQQTRGRDEYSIVLRITEILTELNNVLDSDSLNKMALEYFREKFKTFKDKTDENSKVVLERILHGLAMFDSEFRSTEKLRLKDYSTIPAEEKSSVLLSCCMEGYDKAKLWEMVKNPDNDMESVRLMLSMSHLPDNEEVTEFLNYVSNRPELRANFIYAMFESIANKKYRKELWKWTAANLDSVRNIFRGSSIISRYIEELIAIAGIGNGIEVKEFIEKGNVREAVRGMRNGKERLEINERMIQREGNR